MDERPSCLLVEDQVLIAMALEASLEDAGFVVAGTFATGASAVRWLKSNRPTLAVIDVVLKDGPALQVARELKQKGVPFAVYSGLRPSQEAPELRDVPWLSKPCDRAALLAALTHVAPAPTTQDVAVAV